VVSLGVYVKTLAPTVSFWDCGEFIACAYTLSVPHPPGSPLYILLGRLFSLVPLAEVASRVTFMSALASALSVWCVYLSTLALARSALGGHPLQPLGQGRDLGVIAGAVVASLSLAFSYTQWFNATEAEVYGYSIFFTALGLWLILYWEGTRHGAANDRWLYLLAYLFGLGGGMHLLCLLTIPTLLLLAWWADQKLRRLIGVLVGLGVYGLGALALWGPGVASNLALLVGVGGVLYYLWGADRRAFYLLLGAAVLFGLGYSTYGALYIRSGLNPVIDENDPESWGAFLKFVNREQYGTESLLLGMVQARASRGYQFWDQQMKYFLQQFPFPFLERLVTFRKATDAEAHRVGVSLLPYLLGLGGMLWQGMRDWRRGAAGGAMFVVMGFGLSLYLNMEDPQPRERHYVFGGMYLSFALWMGLGWTGMVEWVRCRLPAWLWSSSLWPSGPSTGSWLVAAIACFGLLLPAGIFARLYHIEDRTGDYIAYDYAYNLLQSCAEHSILFTNGDNDTFPLWYLQEVEGIRKDVRVVNLSLLNTNWYIKQLRDRQPKIDIRYDDAFIDSALTSDEEEALYRRYWPEPQTVSIAGLEWEVRDYAGYNVLRVQDIMVLKIIEWHAWQRPIHFAITVPKSNRAGVDEYLSMTGMTFTLVPQKNPPLDQERMEELLYQVFRLRSILDPEVYKDENATRLLGNYRAIFIELASHYQQTGQAGPLLRLLQWAESHIPLNWDTYYTCALYLEHLERPALAALYMEKAGRAMVPRVGADPNATYDNLVTIADIIQDRHDDPPRASRLYRQAIALEPARPEAYYGLAAALQAQGDAPGALELVEDYIARYGEAEKLIEARHILRRALQQEGRLP
jgi:tetratricopeptide (TPR) repeat protein